MTISRRFVLFCIGLLTAFNVASNSASALMLSENGESRVAICHSNGASDEIVEAAEDMARVLGVMTGGTFDIKSLPEDAKPTNAILLGKLASEAGIRMTKSSVAGDGYRFAVQDGVLGIVGESDRGVVHGIYALLQHMGCGWYVPGDVGEVIPKYPSVVLSDDLDQMSVSDSVARTIWYGGGGNRDVPREVLETWSIRNRALLVAGSWRHAWNHMLPKDMFEKEPDLYALDAKTGKRHNKQICTTNPRTIKLASQWLLAKMEKHPEWKVFEAGPNDGGRLCECDQCAKLHTPGYMEPTKGVPVYTDVVFGFAEELAKITSKKYPDKALGVFIYADYGRPPKILKSISRNVFPMLAPIRRSRLHGPGNPNSYSAVMHGQEMEAWMKISPNFGTYVYNYNLADTQVPFTKFDYYKRVTNYIRNADIKQLGWTCETMDTWANHAPSIYLSARVLWDSQVNIDAALDQFFVGFYGAAAEPMKRYWLRIDNAYATSPTETGSQYGLRQVWTDALLQQCRTDITEARLLAVEPREVKAVEMAEAGLINAELFTQLWDAIGRFDFASAKLASDKLKSHIEDNSKGHTPSWFHQRYVWGYHNRFVGRTVQGGAKILEEGGQIMKPLPLTWKFAKDVDAVGATQGWQSPSFDDSGWREIEVFAKSWADQGLQHYQGDGWYRTTFKLTGFESTADLRLWFGGFDENVDVYLNGKSLGEQKGFATPCEYKNIVEHLNFDGTNTIAVRVSAGSLAELGTGGLMMPVMIYEAGAQKNQVEDEGEAGVDYEM